MCKLHITNPLIRSHAHWDKYSLALPRPSVIIANKYLPLMGALGVIYLQHKKVGLTMTLKHQGCFARLSLRLALVAV